LRVPMRHTLCWLGRCQFLCVAWPECTTNQPFA